MDKQTDLQSKPHYPFPVRLLIEMFNADELQNIESIIHEPTYGFAGRITYKNGSFRMIRGNNLDINSHGASEISKDKGYSKFLLEKLGYKTPKGRVFLSSDYIQLIDSNLSRYDFVDYAKTQHIFDYIQNEAKYPCFIKPNEGSQGQDIYKCYTDEDVHQALEIYRAQCLPRFILEETINLPDYRVVVFNEKVLACYRRHPMEIIGNGQSTVIKLLQNKGEEFITSGRTTRIQLDDKRIQRQLARFNYTFETVLSKGTIFQVYEFANLSTGGSAIDHTDNIHPHWQELCLNITRDMGLKLCGVDLACADIQNQNADYSIIEINSTPGMHNYSTIGDKQSSIVREFYQSIFNQPKLI